MLSHEFKENILFLTGTIDENSTFPEVELPKSITVDCSKIEGINSVGVKHWINYFSTLSDKGISITFKACPPCIVEQINLISNFLAGHKVSTILSPFICSSCDHEELKEMPIDQITGSDFCPEDISCEKCSSPSEFDELPEEYFYFTTRKSA